MQKNRILWGIIAIIAVVGIVWIVAGRRNAGPGAPSASLPAAPSSSLAGEVTVGAVLPLTGEAATIGTAMRKAMDLAVEEINAGNGVEGKKLVVTVEDDACDAATGTTAGEKLMSTTSMKIVLGGTCSDETVALVNLGNQKNVVVLSPFRLAPSDVSVGAGAAAYAHQTLAAKRAAVISESSDGPQGRRKAFTDAFKKSGGIVAFDETYAAGAMSFDRQALKIKNARIDVVYVVPKDPAAGIALVTALKAQKITAKILTTDVLVNADIASKNGDMVEGLISFIPAFDNGNERISRFITKYNARYAETPSLLLPVANMYSLVYLAKDLIGADKTNDAVVMQKILAHLSGWAGGALSNVTLDQNGGIVWTGFAVQQVSKGQVANLGTFTIE